MSAKCGSGESRHIISLGSVRELFCSEAQALWATAPFEPSCLTWVWLKLLRLSLSSPLNEEKLQLAFEGHKLKGKRSMPGNIANVGSTDGQTPAPLSVSFRPTRVCFHTPILSSPSRLPSASVHVGSQSRTNAEVETLRQADTVRKVVGKSSLNSPGHLVPVFFFFVSPLISTGSLLEHIK